MNICFINSTHKWGGVKTWYLELASYLASHGHSVRLFARPGPFLDKAREMGLDAHAFTFGPDLNPLAIYGFIKRLYCFGADCVICNVGKDLRTAGVAARLLSIPIVQRIGSEGDLRNRWKTALEFRYFGQTLFTVCQDIKNKLLAKLPFLDEDRVRVLYSGKSPLPAPPGRTPERPLRLITASQLVTCKGLPNLLQALATLRGQGYAFRYTALGSGPQEEELRTLSKDLGLDDVVDWRGFTTDVPSHLAEADVFLLPSLEEGIPQGLIEAMAHALVPVASRVGGIPEIWPQGLDDSFLIPLEHGVDGIVLALKRLHDATDEEILAWQRAAWEQVRDHLSADRCFAAIQMALTDIIDKQG